MVKTAETIAVRLNAFLFEGSPSNVGTLLQTPYRTAKKYDLVEAWGLEGAIFVKDSKGKRPDWSKNLDALHGSQISDLNTLSASAVLFVKISKRTVAFVFGYGRYLLDDAAMRSDFGIKTALNTLNNKTLRSVDLYSLEQDPMLKRTQALRASNINAFGIDVSRDILKAVTGEPSSGIPWHTIHGSGAQYSFTAQIRNLTELKNIASDLSAHYDKQTYKTDFEWVDNIQRVRNDALTAALDGLLVAALNSSATPPIELTLPHIVDWDLIAGFSFTNAKTKTKPMLSASDYFSVNPAMGHTLERLKSNRIFLFDVHGNESSYSVYNCIYFECTYHGKVYVLFSKDWFTIDQKFMARIDKAIGTVPVSTLTFPQVKTEFLAGTGKKVGSSPVLKVEAEGDYNARVSANLGYHLLDKKLVKPRTGASPIELCDLLTNNLELIHAKHRKGGSAGLSHMFAQGRIAAELLLSDQEFRKDAKTKLPHGVKSLIDASRCDPGKHEVVFLVLGDSPADVKQKLPFFSKVNLWLTYQSLSQRNFKVSITGAPLAPPLSLSAKPIVVGRKPKTGSTSTGISPGSTAP